MTVSNATLNGVVSLTTVKDSLFNKEMRRKDMRIDNAKTLFIENK